MKIYSKPPNKQNPSIYETELIYNESTTNIYNKQFSFGLCYWYFVWNAKSFFYVNRKILKIPGYIGTFSVAIEMQHWEQMDCMNGSQRAVYEESLCRYKYKIFRVKTK